MSCYTMFSLASFNHVFISPIFFLPKDYALGRGKRNGDMSWQAKPGYVSEIDLSKQTASWVGAGGTNTYIQISSSLLTTERLPNAAMFASPTCLGE